MEMIKHANLELLRVLIAVAEAPNFREAARKLRMSQAGVSLKIKELESLQSIPIFQVEGKRKVLTRFGRSLYEAARDGVQAIELGLERVHRTYASAEQLAVRIGGRFDVLEFVAPYLEFAGRLEFIDASGRDAVTRLLAHEIDIAISYLPPNSSEIQAIKLFDTRAFFVAHRHLLESTFSRNVQDWHSVIDDTDYLTRSPCVSYRRDGSLVSDWAARTGIRLDELNVRYFAEDWRTVYRLVVCGVGYAIVPFYAIHPSDDIVRIPFPDGYLPRFAYYALFERGLRQLDAFKSLLAFDRLRHGVVGPGLVVCD